MAEVIKAFDLFQLASQDQRIEWISLTSDIKTEDQFLNEMRAFSYAKKRPASSSNNSSADPEVR